MKIQIKKSIKTVKYEKAIRYLEKRVNEFTEGKGRELIWILQHDHVYTYGTSSKNNEILDKNIKLVKTNRGGKITYHGPGQLVFYFVIDLKKRNKDIRDFLTKVEKTIIQSIKHYNIKTFADRRDIGIWHKEKNELKKVGAIGLKIKKWIVYHGFSININSDLRKYNKIIPCGIKDKGITNLVNIKKKNYQKLSNILIKNFLNYFEI
tara:strand:- start:454 stop:1074 length:621 start_codon:yes stop_codon:yes gene_type:complete